MKSTLPRFAILLCLLALSLSLSFSASAADSPQAALRQARNLYEQKHFEESLALTRQVVAGNPEEATAGEAHRLICQVRAALPDLPTPENDPSILLPSKQPSSDPDFVSRPEILFRVQPKYTKEARNSGIQGTVILTGVVDEEGCMSGIKLLHGIDPGLDAAAITALRQWTFRPAQRQGKPVKVYYTTTTSFAVEKGKP